MSRRAAPTQAQITRAIKAAQATGLAVSGVKVDGTQIVVLTSSVGNDQPQTESPLDAWLKRKQNGAKKPKHDS